MLSCLPEWAQCQTGTPRSVAGAGARLDPGTALSIPGQLGLLGWKLSNAEPKFS